ncbi:hypothetical protein COLO4_28168 [Corchorus olitorius]|uniref:Uncharacterized protein n=1 Tax=Corchorus olitorius TaxID=93759 RepID=A0A1R3HML3_9ROSI|nr:hypothetical protein COLO4_28168 [Corchorus olitorius]
MTGTERESRVSRVYRVGREGSRRYCPGAGAG